MISSILELLGGIVELKVLKERNKYRDEYMRLEREWYAEYNKPDGKRSRAVLDNLRFEILLLCRTVSAEIRKPNP